MPVKQFKPTSPGTRGMSKISNEDITTDKPHKPLLRVRKEHAGRNNNGRITCRHKGAGVRKAYRIIDFKRNKLGVPGKVLTVEYDPNRNVRICLIGYADGDKRYILKPEALKVGDVLNAGPEAEIKPGNALPLKNIPLGTVVHNVELTPGKGGQMVRAAGGSAQVVAKEGEFVTLRLPSTEMRMVRIDCYATVGALANADQKHVSIGKAGRKRHMGIRPTVRGSVMNPVDHPHGGGEGKCPIGRPSPVTPWGKPTLGYKTRNKTKNTSRMIVRGRVRGKTKRTK